MVAGFSLHCAGDSNRHYLHTEGRERTGRDMTESSRENWCLGASFIMKVRAFYVTGTDNRMVPMLYLNEKHPSIVSYICPRMPRQARDRVRGCYRLAVDSKEDRVKKYRTAQALPAVCKSQILILLCA